MLYCIMLVYDLGQLKISRWFVWMYGPPGSGGISLPISVLNMLSSTLTACFVTGLPC